MKLTVDDFGTQTLLDVILTLSIFSTFPEGTLYDIPGVIVKT
jgi:hypothetical protein